MRDRSGKPEPAWILCVVGEGLQRIARPQRGHALNVLGGESVEVNSLCLSYDFFDFRMDYDNCKRCWGRRF